MSISIGGIDIATAIVNIDLQLIRTQKLLEWIVNNNVGLRGPDQATMVAMEQQAAAAVKAKYPEAGLEWNPG